MQRVAQLSFDVFPGGGTPRWQSGEEKRPLAATISVAGSFDLEEAFAGEDGLPQLDHGEEVMVTLASASGELIATATGTVEVGFKDKKVTGVTMPVRVQKVKL